MTRRKGRILAFQGVYSWDVGHIPVDEVLTLSWANNGEGASVSEENGAFARVLIAGTIEHHEEIDALIKTHLTSWDFERVNKVSIAILRISVYSFLYQKDVLPSIIIDEAIHLAKDFGPEDSFRFINAILDNIKKTLSSNS